jgi:secreted PhoX family phosphatase
VDFIPVVGTDGNCSGTVTPWNTIFSCEEYTSEDLVASNLIKELDINSDGYGDLGWTLGNFKHENLAIHQNQRTVYQGTDKYTGFGYLYKFVADAAQDLNSGRLYVYKGPKNGNGDWVLLNNTTKEERNTTKEQSAALSAANFLRIKDVEIEPNGGIYFAVKNESRCKGSKIPTQKRIKTIALI